MTDDKQPNSNDDDTGLWQRVIKSVRPFGVNPPIEVEIDHAETVSFADLLDADPAPRSADNTVLIPLESSRAPSKKTMKKRISKSVVKDIRDMGDEVDRRTFDRLKQGKLPISASLDLHGMTQDTAHVAVKGFIHRHYDLKHRLVLIVTGKGRLSPFGIGVLKKNLPNWLKDPDIKPMILKTVQARQKDGGGGAFYVYLRKNRS